MRVKSFLLLAALLCFAKTFYGQSSFPYDSAWKKIDNLLQKKGLPQSALTEVNKVYAVAKKDRREDQWIKAAIYRIQLTENGQDEPGFRLSAWDSAIENSPARVRAVLLSAEAAALQGYPKQRYYRPRGTTPVTGDSSGDVATWSPEKLRSVISGLYLQSLTEKELLQHTSLNGYEAILVKGNSRVLRPTLYDLLLFRALDYFMLPETDNQIIPREKIAADPRMFSGASIFRRSELPLSDSSHWIVALRLFQDVLRFHEPDADASASVDADISRLQYVYSWSTAAGKDSLFLSALSRITAAFPRLPPAAEAGFLQASYYNQRAANYDPFTDTTHRFDRVTAKTIAEKYATLTDSSAGRAHCRELIRQITRTNLVIEAEMVNLPGLPFRVSVSYANAPKLFGRIIRIDDPTRESLTQNGFSDKTWKRLANLPAEKKFSFALPVTNDYQQHRVELPVEALPRGQYVLFCSSDSSFSTGSSLVATYFFNSSLAIASLGDDYFVADRNSGKPLAGVRVEVYHFKYDNKKKGLLRTPDAQYVTDLTGHLSPAISDTDPYSQRTFTYSLNGDYLTISNERPKTYTNDEPEEKMDELTYSGHWMRASLFTDRGIYRPGQKVFFKTLLVTRDFKTTLYKPSAGTHSKVYLTDVNGQGVDSISYVASAFGSFSSAFTLPAAGLTGIYRITDSLTGTSSGFSVEEYKRPKFYVSIDTPSGNLHLNDSVRFHGTATAYAGNAVNNAQVVYRIYRQATFPYYWYFRNLPASQEEQLGEGTVKTDENGAFSVWFKAVPDAAAKLSGKPVFTYRIAVSVTDGNGESHDGAGSVALSSQSFQLRSTLPGESVFSADSLAKFPLTTYDANGRFLPQSVTVSLYSLQMPDRLIRQRYWDQPDLFLLDKKTFLGLFPTDEYANESDKKSWPITGKIAEHTSLTRADGTFPLALDNPGKLSGWFLAVFSGRDSNGDSIIDKRWIALGIGKSSKPLYPEYNINTSGTITAEPGNAVSVVTGSSVAPVHVFRVRIPVTDSLRVFSQMVVKDGIDFTRFNLTENDRGGFVIADMFIVNNRIYINSHEIVVPWSNKQLNIGFKTWKDKTMPGSKETWTLQILGSEKEKVSAEVLTAMYDASLDAFSQTQWAAPEVYPTAYGEPWSGFRDFAKAGSLSSSDAESSGDYYEKTYDGLLDERLRSGAARMGGGRINLRGVMSAPMMDETRISAAPAASPLAERSLRFEMKTQKPEMSTEDSIPGMISPGRPSDPAVAIRKNFNETAFFFPDLHTDADGTVTFSFTMPEALTKWKWMVFAHTKDLAFGLGEKSVITQKELMLLPNMPRFLRQGDSLQVPVKISNLSGKDLMGKVRLDWRDAGDSSERNTAFGNQKPEQSFSVPAGQSRTYFFSTSVPAVQQQPVYYRLVATTGGPARLSDGEEGILPVLSNRRLVTETLPIRLNKETVKLFEWDKLLRSDSSKTLQQHSLTVEYSTRPAWYAVQSLPYLMEFPYECAEQTFDRYYANALGAQIVDRVPGMAGVLAAWKSGDSSALQSNLEKNEELKNVLLKETPWVVEAKTETAQKQQLAKLLDKEKLAGEMKKALGKLQALQSGGGGFPWFAGGRDDRYITQYIVTGIGHLLKLKALPEADQPAYVDMVKKALVFLDAEIKRDYDSRPKKASGNLGPLQIQYLYMRSFFRDIDVPGPAFFAVNYYRLQARQYWTDQNMYLRGMIALFLNRNGDKQTAQDILKSLRENAVTSDNDGTYWKRSGLGYYWQEFQVETQSLLIETFAELGKSGETDNMKWWLLQQKQTTHWSSTKSTAGACYALLMNGSDWLGNEQQVIIKLGNETIKSGAEKANAGTGYFKKIIPAEKIVPSMGHITVSTSSFAGKTVPSFGAVYWQYFEELENITAAGTSLSVTKTLFIQKNTGNGVVGEALPVGATLQVGDKLLMRFIIKTDRDLNYVQLKDQRAACLEPVQVLSGYQWQGDLGYYQASGDESTSFFFDYLPKGTHVVEYPVYVTTSGVFSSGIGTLQTMYAPEFAGHTAGSRLQVTEK